jgi:flagellar basal-body rod protein FlgB
MEAALYATEARQRVIANNIANAETPNFKRSELVFEQLIENAMGTNTDNRINGKKTHEKHITIGKGSLGLPKAELVSDNSTAMNPLTNNNVDVETEMALLAKNQLNNQLYSTQITHEITMKRLAITGR